MIRINIIIIFQNNSGREELKNNLIRVLDLKENQVLYRCLKHPSAVDLKKLDYSKWNRIINEISKTKVELKRSAKKTSPKFSVQTSSPLLSSSGYLFSPLSSKRSDIPVHLSPTGILNQLDSYKHKWLDMKSKRLTEERNQEILAAKEKKKHK